MSGTVPMQLPVLIEPLTGRAGFLARVGDPFNLSAEAETPEEALRRLADALGQRLQAGSRVAALPVPPVNRPPPPGGWLPDDDLTREWLQAVEEYRRECDQLDRRRILGEEEDGKGGS